MRVYLGGYLDFYHPRREHWLTVTVAAPTPLGELLPRLGIPPGEVNLTLLNGELVNLEDAVVSDEDEVKLFSAVGGG